MLVDLLHIKSSQVDIFRQYIGNAADKNNNTAKNTTESVKDARCRKVTVKRGNAKQYDCGALYVKNLT